MAESEYLTVYYIFKYILYIYHDYIYILCTLTNFESPSAILGAPIQLTTRQLLAYDIDGSFHVKSSRVPDIIDSELLENLHSCYVT